MTNNNLNYEELRNALTLIQNVCLNIDDCATCPFGNDDEECFIIENAPHSWRFTDPIPVVRLMK